MARAEQAERCVLVLQGGGALGAYQGGVYEALAASDYIPEWVAGISIGAVNAALIAGNPPDKRVSALRAFWTRASSRVPFPSPYEDGWGRKLFNEGAAATIAMTGIPGFFTPRWSTPWTALPGSPEAISLYDTAPLRETLLELVDFDLLNDGPLRFSVGAVNVLTGNFVYFDNRERRIGPEHIMASGALPPGFPPMMIDGEPFWDGGIVSNTPLEFVLDERRADPLLVFQVDLFSARGMMPRTLAEAAQREKDIRFSSRTRLNTDIHKRIAQLQAAAARLIDKLPEHLRDDPDVATLTQHHTCGAVTIMHLINRAEGYESEAKDYEFSRMTVDGHWQSGMDDVARSLASPRWRHRHPPSQGIVTLDLG
ncbi:patatin [Novosphingobium nitrogenifigens DSM 19370]|uniref:Patatin n=1 Tax=Novosphingobium nitrogenifigens DSM 19370 TaxID=983920 RepID=F1Z823_9SPHN|nr:patatin-like phospholipase family protein [Novosphingobium nitrogenifigens]EGD59202.1 patatin [Novosphingobium nitrogenifigens DSM 19370]